MHDPLYMTVTVWLELKLMIHGFPLILGGWGDDDQLLPLPSALYEGGLLCGGQLVPVLTLWQELGGEDYIGNGMNISSYISSYRKLYIKVEEP